MAFFRHPYCYFTRLFPSSVFSSFPIPKDSSLFFYFLQRSTYLLCLCPEISEIFYKPNHSFPHNRTWFSQEAYLPLLSAGRHVLILAILPILFLKGWALKCHTALL